MEVITRLCCIEDAAAIQKLNSEELGYSYPGDEMERKLEDLLADNKNRIYVAMIGGNIVGYVHACDYDVLYAPHMKNIMGIAVSSGCRRMGIGRALLRSVEEWAKNTGAVGIRLVSGSDRVGAHVFYHSCGYDSGKTQLNFKKYL